LLRIATLWKLLTEKNKRVYAFDPISQPISNNASDVGRWHYLKYQSKIEINGV
jgi:hypothetical protein